MAFSNTIPDNVLVNVQTWQKSDLAFLQNSYCGIDIANKKLSKFPNLTAQLGDTVTFDLSPRAYAINGLVVSDQEAAQRTQSLICSQSANSSMAFNDQMFIFNADEYIERFSIPRMTAVGGKIEIDLLLNAVSGVRGNTPGQSNFGQIVDPTSGPYRFYGDGVTPINSFGQLQTAVANFIDYGFADSQFCGILPITRVPAIVNTGLGQFAIDRNNTLALDWKLGTYAGCKWYSSNLLPVHIAGTVGNAAGSGNQLTLVSTNDPTGANITQLTLSGATNDDLNAIKSGDLAQFIDGVSGKPNMRYLTFQLYQPSEQPVQFRILNDAAADGSGNVVVNIHPALQSAPGLNQNLNNSLSAGMKVQFLPSHRAGLLMSGMPLYLATPELPDMDPFKTVSTRDSASGLSIRHYWGATLGTGVSKRYIWDQIWATTLVAENCMRLIFPL